MDNDKKPSRRHRPAKTEPRPPWWLQHARERPLAVTGTTITVVGSLILLWFFCLLGEMPELDLAGIGAISMAVAVVGFVIAFALTACGFGAGIAMRDPTDGFMRLSMRQSALLFMPPGLLCVVVLAIGQLVSPHASLLSWAAAASVALMFVLSFVFAWFVSSEQSVGGSEVNRTLKTKWERLFTYSVHGLLWWSATLIAILMFTLNFPRDGSLALFVLGLAAWVVFCHLQNLVVARVTKVKMIALLPACSGFSLVVLLMLTGNGAGFPKVAMSLLGLGEIPVALVLTEEGCDLLNKGSGGPAVCRTVPGEKTAVVCPAMLRSRISSPVFVGISGYEEDGRWPQLHPPRRLQAIAIPKAEVRSWSRIAPVAASAPLTAASGVVVTYLAATDQGQWLREQCGRSPVSAGPTAPASPASAVPTH